MNFPEMFLPSIYMVLPTIRNTLHTHYKSSIPFVSVLIMCLIMLGNINMTNDVLNIKFKDFRP